MLKYLGVACGLRGLKYRRAAQFQERAEQFVRMDNVAAPVFAMGVDNPSPAISGKGAAIAPRPTGSTELVSDDFPVFHLTMATPQRYQTFVERSITPSGMGIEIYLVLDSQTNERVAKSRNQAEAVTIAYGLNAAIRAY
jgi:hypothetical protein